MLPQGLERNHSDPDSVGAYAAPLVFLILIVALLPSNFPRSDLNSWLLLLFVVVSLMTVALSGILRRHVTQPNRQGNHGAHADPGVVHDWLNQEEIVVSSPSGPVSQPSSHSGTESLSITLSEMSVGVQRTRDPLMGLCPTDSTTSPRQVSRRGSPTSSVMVDGSIVTRNSISEETEAGSRSPLLNHVNNSE